MPSETSVANLALTYLGTRSQIANLTENSTEALAIRPIFDDTRDEILQMANWDFAAKTDYLGVLKMAPGATGSTDTSGATEWSTDYPAPPWQYEYATPSDCLRVRWISPAVFSGGFDVPLFSSPTGSIMPYNSSVPRVRFRLGFDEIDGAQQQVILTNQYQAIATYTVRATIPTVWPQLFCNALSMALAAKVCNQLTGESGKQSQFFNAANAFIKEARVLDGQQGTTTTDVTPDWIAIRDTWAVPAPGIDYIYPYAGLYSSGI